MLNFLEERREPQIIFWKFHGSMNLVSDGKENVLMIKIQSVILTGSPKNP